MNENSIRVAGFMPETLPDKTADGTKQPIILQQITVRPVNRQSQDIGKWRAAHRAAESYIPRRVMLYDLYADVMLDGHVIGVTQKLVDAITGADWMFVDKEGNPIDEVNELIESMGFDDLLTEIYNAELWGYSMIECDFYTDFEGKKAFTAYQCDRKHMRPIPGIIAIDQNGDTGINIREGIYPAFVMEVGKPRDLGLLLPVAQYAILKDGDISDWAAFVQTFGRPLLDAEWDGFDENQRIQLNQSLEDMGAGGVITRPSGTKLNIIEAKSNADGKLQNNLLDALNKEISKTLLTATEGTESSNSSGYAQSETHGDMETNRKKTLIKKVGKILNTRFKKILAAQGFQTKGGKFINKPTDEQLSKKDSYPIHKSMKKDLNIPIDDEFFYKTYGVEKPDDYEAQKTALEAKNAEIQQNLPGKKGKDNANTPPASGGKNGEQPPPEDTTKNRRRMVKLWDRIDRFFRLAPAITPTGATTKQPVMTCCGDHPAVTNRFIQLADINDNDSLISRMYAAGGRIEFDSNLFAFTAQTLLDGLHGGWEGKPLVQLSDIGFTYGVNDPALLTAFELNLFRFSGVKTLAEAQELNKLFRESKSFAEFTQKAGQVTETFNQKWLQTEYNTAYFTGESAATYTRLMSQVQTFPYWEYKTVGDDRVRPGHRALHGLILPANDPRWLKLYPPNGWNCRCYVVPRTRDEVANVDFAEMRARADAYFETAEFAIMEAQGWGVNRSVTGEVFTANQQYIRKLEGKASKALNNLGAPDYNLPSYSQAKKVAETVAPAFEDTAATFIQDQEQRNGKAIIQDYNNRPLALDSKNFTTHTTGKKAERVQYLSAMKETLQSPDEVWLNGDKLDDLVYIKYYNDLTLVTIANVDKNNVTEVSTWFTLTESKEVINRYRRGLLIKGEE